MRDIVILSKEELNKDICYKCILNYYKGAKDEGNQIFIGKPPKSMFVYFPSNLITDSIEDWYEEYKNIIPSEYKFVTHVDFHLDQSVLNLLMLLKDSYPDLFIMDDNNVNLNVNEYIIFLNNKIN